MEKDDNDDDDDDERFLPSKYLKSNLKSRKYKIEEDENEAEAEDCMSIPYNYPTIEEDINAQNLNEAINMWENIDYYRDPIIYNRNNINDGNIMIVNNGKIPQQKANIRRIHQLQNIINGMNENIRQYNLKINQKEDETDNLIGGDSNDDNFNKKQQVNIKKIKSCEDSI
jgi:hypothetical protein